MPLSLDEIVDPRAGYPQTLYVLGYVFSGGQMNMNYAIHKENHCPLNSKGVNQYYPVARALSTLLI